MISYKMQQKVLPQLKQTTILSSLTFANMADIIKR